MSASSIVRHVYQETILHFGEPDGSIAFDDPPPPPGSGWPVRIDVLHWKDADDLDITTFATVGMADSPMQKCSHRCELHFSIRAKARDLDLHKISHFCACLALYPYMNDTFFDWAQLIRSPGEIPEYPNCCSLVFHPAFVDDGWDSMDYDGIHIRIMNMVPITPHELAYRDKNGPFSIFDYFCDNEIDIFKDRS